MSDLTEDMRRRVLDEQDKADLHKNPSTQDMMVSLERLVGVSSRIKLHDPPMGRPADIWELATEQCKTKPQVVDGVTTVYISGSEGGGKTTLLSIFLERKESAIKKTVALDFSYARRINTMLNKELVNFWELGGDARKWPNLIDIPVIGCPGLNQFTAVIVLDLSRPISIWPVLEKVMSGLQSGFNEAIHQMDKATAVAVTQEMEEEMRKRLEKIPEKDREFIKPFHLPVVFIGTKFDLFKNLEPETVKVVCRVLRLTAHIIGAWLVFFTREDYKVKRRIRELFSHFAFHSKPPKDLCHENGECLFIPSGTDSFEKIWPKKPTHYNLDFCKRYIETKIGKDVIKLDSKRTNPADDGRFLEPPVDRLRAKIIEDMNYRKQQSGDH